jgi:GNAT superfamily N-acetyltransferase
MGIQFRHYASQAGMTEDYHRVRRFFCELGDDLFDYARWDWMATHSWLDRDALQQIGLWLDEDRVVAAATFDTQPGTGYCLTLPAYAYLKRDMLLYAREHLRKNGSFSVVIGDDDPDFQSAAADLGFIATQDREYVSGFYPQQTATAYTLPAGFGITSLDETFDLFQYRRVLWKGFDHEPEGPFEFTDETKRDAAAEMMRPHVDLSLKIAAVAADGNFVSYCGLWYDRQLHYAVVEPLATDPAYRRLGLGKAVVLEGIQRVARRGAKRVLVGSAQPFYYHIGFRPYRTSTVWREKS